MIHLLRKLPHDQDYDDAVSNEVEQKRVSGAHNYFKYCPLLQSNEHTQSLFRGIKNSFQRITCGVHLNTRC